MEGQLLGTQDLAKQVGPMEQHPMPTASAGPCGAAAEALTEPNKSLSSRGAAKREAQPGSTAQSAPSADQAPP